VQDIRLFTWEDANALVPELERLVVEARRLTDRVRAAEAHVDDLRIVWGERLESPDCPDHGEFLARTADLKARRLEFAAHLRRFEELGVEFKGVDLGLVDLYSLNGDRLVYLCWRAGEKEIAAWHTLSGGFQGRRPIPDYLAEGAER
jgi:hypothetical protein